jgi:tetratricopeptide (TPR) repeat protein
MRKALLKAAFVTTVLCFAAILFCLSVVARDALFPMIPGPDGLYRNGGGGGPFQGILITFACVCVADRCASLLFKLARASDDRWSLFRRGLVVHQAKNAVLKSPPNYQICWDSPRKIRMAGY